MARTNEPVKVVVCRACGGSRTTHTGEERCWCARCLALPVADRCPEFTERERETFPTDVPRAAAGSSREAGEFLSKSGKTTELAVSVLAAAENAVDYGLTVKEFRAEHPELHHGLVSGVFSKLHERGFLARLTARRERYEVYVLDRHVYGRETRQPAAKVKADRHRALMNQIAHVEWCLGNALWHMDRVDVDTEVRELIRLAKEVAGPANY